MIDPVLRIALGLHEAMRRVGVPAADIFLLVPKSLEVSVVLGHVGFPIGPVAGPRSTVHARWREACAWWNTTATDAERAALWAEFQGQVDAVSLVMAITQARKTMETPPLASTAPAEA